ncbi:MAG TPA: SpoIIE family protein phosphatase [Actinomycetota bacterium]|nr:SpoIIE family protein phosphatase [Actinomycetota bacterium]
MTPLSRSRDLLFGFPEIDKGSRDWIRRVAELGSYGALGLVLTLVLLSQLPPLRLATALVLLGLLALWTLCLFRLLLPRPTRPQWEDAAALALSLGLAAALYATLRGAVPTAQLVLVPVVAITGLLTSLRVGLSTGVLAAVLYTVIAEVTGTRPSSLAVAVVLGVFVLSGSIAGLLTQELRSHYRGEQQEHRLATAVRHRLLAVLDAVDEAIVFRDRQGAVRVINRRAADLFEVDPDDYLGTPAVELLRQVARRTEDPEGFMESFQELRDDPELEMRLSIEQLLPQRRRLRLYSGPARDDSGLLVGRIDVYTDVTDAVRRAEEIERLYEDARETAESYQRGLLPDTIPKLPRVNLVAHYIAARGRRAVCGDFYDFVTLPGGRVAVVLGDVCGIGPAAANDAAFTRYTLRSFVTEEADPARLMDRLNKHVGTNLSQDRFVRLLLGVLDPERAGLEYVNAGHVPPLVYRAASGRAEWLSEGELALGVNDGVGYGSENVELNPGDMLVFYADGVTEGMRKGRVFGQGKLQDLVEEYGLGTPGELVQAIRRAVESWAPEDELRDDVALLVCQVVPDSAIAEPTRELLLPNEPARAKELRSFVAAYLADLRAPIEVTQEIVIAVGEAASNACKYGRRPDGRSEIRIRCALEGSEVVILVSDDGPGIDLDVVRQNGLPDRFSSGGRGMFLMNQLMDSVDFQGSGSGTTVVLRRHLPRVTAA